MMLLKLFKIVRDLIGVELTIKSCVCFPKRGQEWARLECSYTINNVLHDDVYISTSAEKLVEAAKQFNVAMCPFTTTIVVDNKGFYEFT